MIVKTYKPKVLKIASLLGLGFLALAPWLSAENSGFYGSVGFQYSNMTRAESSNGNVAQMPSGTVLNELNRPGPTATAPSTNASSYTTPNASAILGNPTCTGLNCNATTPNH